METQDSHENKVTYSLLYGAHHIFYVIIFYVGKL